jgi:VWFA-related protein
MRAPSEASQAQEPAPATQKPVFRAGTERIAIDAAVLDKDGGPVAGLTAGDFTLTIDGAPRRVLSAEFVSQATGGASDKPARAKRLHYSTNESAVGGRLVLLAFDLEGIAAGSGRDAAKAATEFVNRLSPGDQVGVISFPYGVGIEFTGDRARVAAALEKVAGRGLPTPMSLYTVGVQEAFDIEGGNTYALDRAIARECPPTERRQPGDEQVVLEDCPPEIRRIAHDIAMTHRRRLEDVARVFRTLLQQLKGIDAPKIVVWISEGLSMPFDSGSDLGQLSAEAAAARVTVYVIHLDRNSMFDASTAKPSPTPMEDRGAARLGLDLLAGVSRGAVFSTIGTGDNAFNRIAREMTAYYLLSAEPDARDRDGRTHKIKVTLSRPGLTVRARRDFAVVVNGGSELLTPEQAVANVLITPLLATELPLKVATYSTRLPGDTRVRLVISTEVGHDAIAPDAIAIGFIVTDANGKVIRNGFRQATMTPIRRGEPGPLETTSVTEIEPGSYTLKLAVVDSRGRRGSVEHPFTAGLTRLGSIDLADFLLAPAKTREPAAARIVADPTIDGEPFDGYLELYGSIDADHPPTVAIEVADSDAGPALDVQLARITPAKDNARFVATAPLPLGLLPPGDYVARATVTLDGVTSQLLRPFTLAKTVPAGDVFKAELAKQVGAFRAAQIMTVPLLSRALQSASESSDGASSDAAAAASAVASGKLAALDNLSLPADDHSLLASFLRGLGLYRKGSIEEAAKEFRLSVRASPDFLAGILYLGACYASGGRTKEAIGAWQTSLIGDDASPEIFALVADGYLRLGDAEAAADILIEASMKWPEDERFIVRSALARAGAGHPDEALTALMPALERTTDPEILTLAARLAIADVARRPAAEQRERLPQLRDLSSRLGAGKGDASPVLARWIAYLESQPP